MSKQITIDKVTKKRAGYSLLISAREESLLVSRESYYRHRLKEGIVITLPQLNQLVEESLSDSCEREVIRLLGLRDRSMGELRTKLIQKGHASKVIKSILKKYTDNGLLDDQRFATNFARRTMERKPVGRSYLIAMLQKKYIERSLAEQAVNCLLSSADENDAATTALEHRWRQFSQFDVETARNKAYNYLSRRGFGYEAARAAFEVLQQRAEEVDED